MKLNKNDMIILFYVNNIPSNNAVSDPFLTNKNVVSFNKLKNHKLIKETNEDMHITIKGKWIVFKLSF